MTGEVCKACDGRKVVRKRTDFGTWEDSKTPCSSCGGSGVNRGPSKGNRRFRKKIKEELTEEEMTLEQQTQAFLRKHGF